MAGHSRMTNIIVLDRPPTHIQRVESQRSNRALPGLPHPRPIESRARPGLAHVGQSNRAGPKVVGTESGRAFGAGHCVYGFNKGCINNLHLSAELQREKLVEDSQRKKTLYVSCKTEVSSTREERACVETQ
uniref:Uncharacterized protein n=1 Tax=Trichuris muris TaxID=70415 RepID=A0A5S6QQ35_TRIMR